MQKHILELTSPRVHITDGNGKQKDTICKEINNVDSVLCVP